MLKSIAKLTRVRFDRLTLYIVGSNCELELAKANLAATTRLAAVTTSVEKNLGFLYKIKCLVTTLLSAIGHLLLQVLRPKLQGEKDPVEAGKNALRQLLPDAEIVEQAKTIFESTGKLFQATADMVSRKMVPESSPR